MSCNFFKLVGFSICILTLNIFSQQQTYSRLLLKDQMTSTPSELKKLTIVSSSSTDGLLGYANNLSKGYELTAGQTASYFKLYYSGSDLVTLSAYSSGSKLSLWSCNPTVENVVIRANGISYFDGGNVGIGTNNPGTYKLAVEGKIGAREIVVTNLPWADFVFKPDYNLKPLNEVEQFIKTNNHLEGIPTEKEVKENGVALGEMQAKLLQKVEELTLYMVELNKENTSLKSKVAELENKISK
jgi:hypothetical protein